MKKLIDFPDVVLKKVETIREREGHKTFTSALFSTVSQYYDRKYYSKYKGAGVVRSAEFSEELTPEQACEKVGGKVETVNGIPMCALQITDSMTRRVPLSKPELFRK